MHNKDIYYYYYHYYYYYYVASINTADQDRLHAHGDVNE